MKALGHGIGLRPQHFGDFLDRENVEAHKVDWLEVISENFMWQDGRPRAVLDELRTRYPIVLHGVSLSIGAVDPPNRAYLTELQKLAAECEPAWISDHLCFGSNQGRYAHDLLPLPYTEEALSTVVSNVQIVQDVLKRRLLLENVSSYISFADSQLSEWDFLAEVARRADCGILLDINNIYVSAKNHSFDARDYLRGVPKERVQQFHLAGHEDRGAYLFDSHDHPIADGVWKLYEDALKIFGPVSTLIERDDNIPPLAEVIAESEHARALAEKVRHAR